MVNTQVCESILSFSNTTVILIYVAFHLVLPLAFWIICLYSIVYLF